MRRYGLRISPPWTRLTKSATCEKGILRPMERRQIPRPHKLPTATAAMKYRTMPGCDDMTTAGADADCFSFVPAAVVADSPLQPFRPLAKDCVAAVVAVPLSVCVRGSPVVHVVVNIFSFVPCFSFLSLIFYD